MVNIGLVGTGRIVKEAWLPASMTLADDVCLHLCTRSGQRPTWFPTSRHKIYRDFDEMLVEERMDLIVIATPPITHAFYALGALRRGIAVIIEKPLATCVADAITIADEAEKMAVRAFVSYPRRFSSGARNLKQMLFSQALGKIVTVNYHTLWHRAGEYYKGHKGMRSVEGGGVLINQGIHCLDMLGCMFSQPLRACALGHRQVHNCEVEDTATLLLDFGSFGCSIVCTTAAGVNEDYELKVVGSLGTAILRPNQLNVCWNDGQSQVSEVYTQNLVNLFSRQLDAALADRTAHRPDICSVRDGVRSVAVVEAAYTSMINGCWSTVAGC